MSKIRTNSAPELFLEVRRGNAEPLHVQLEQQLREGIRGGRLLGASNLPSSRALALGLGVSRGVVVEAFAQLAAEGYLVTRPGGSTGVADSAVVAAARAQPARPRAPRIEFDLRPGRPDLDLFPREVWLRSARRVLAEAPSQRLGYLDGRGVPELREALSTYLNRVRGTAAGADAIVVSSGFTQGLALVAGVLVARGVRRVGLEDPGLAESRRVIAAAGLTVVPIAVDESGLRVDLLAAADVDAILVTPAHQYPTGAVLAADRRAALLDWAARGDRLIIEDDYDAEFRYDRQPIGALQGLAPEHVVYAGTASKVLAPGLRLGWLVLPASLVEPIADAKLRADLGSPAIDQLIVADLVARGDLGRHLRRMRPIYRRRRDALLLALRRYLPALKPVGASAGIHVLAWLPSGLDAARLVKVAAEEGIGLAGYSSPTATPDGIVFGYAAASEPAIREGISRLAVIVTRTGVSRRT
jgi:GntR family transcriptional regulator/MocR family aminotransferase